MFFGLWDFKWVWDFGSFFWRSTEVFKFDYERFSEVFFPKLTNIGDVHELFEVKFMLKKIIDYCDSYLKILS